MGKNKQKQATITEGSQPGTVLESPYSTQIPGGRKGQPWGTQKDMPGRMESVISVPPLSPVIQGELNILPSEYTRLVEVEANSFIFLWEHARRWNSLQSFEAWILMRTQCKAMSLYHLINWVILAIVEFFIGELYLDYVHHKVILKFCKVIILMCRISPYTNNILAHWYWRCCWRGLSMQFVLCAAWAYLQWCSVTGRFATVTRAAVEES